jgi:hypothetical protein
MVGDLRCDIILEVRIKSGASPLSEIKSAPTRALSPAVNLYSSACGCNTQQMRIDAVANGGGGKKED